MDITREPLEKNEQAVKPRGPDKRERVKLDKAATYRLTKWLERTTKKILDERPTRPVIARWASNELKMNLTEYHIEGLIHIVIPDYKPIPTVKAATVAEDHRVAMRILSSALLDMYTKLGEKQPPALLALYDRYRPVQGPTKANSILPATNGSPPSAPPIP